MCIRDRSSPVWCSGLTSKLAHICHESMAVSYRACKLLLSFYLGVYFPNVMYYCTKPVVTSLFIILKWVCYVLCTLITWAELSLQSTSIAGVLWLLFCDNIHHHLALINGELYFQYLLGCLFTIPGHCFMLENILILSQSSPDFVTIPVNTTLHVHVWELVPTVIQCASTSVCLTTYNLLKRNPLLGWF